jgi:hypothetical protein
MSRFHLNRRHSSEPSGFSMNHEMGANQSMISWVRSTMLSASMRSRGARALLRAME